MCSYIRIKESTKNRDTHWLPRTRFYNSNSPTPKWSSCLPSWNRISRNRQLKWQQRYEIEHNFLSIERAPCNVKHEFFKSNSPFVQISNPDDQRFRNWSRCRNFVLRNYNGHRSLVSQKPFERHIPAYFRGKKPENYTVVVTTRAYTCVNRETSNKRP